MKKINFEKLAGIAVSVLLSTATPYKSASADDGHRSRIRHVLLLSVDGFHALDLENCVKGVSGLAPYCPNLGGLAQNGIRYMQASSSKPSDSFPGLLAMITGGTPRSTGVFYDNSYDRSLAGPASPTNDVAPGSCTPGMSGTGTQVLYDETIDNDSTKLDGGGGINPANLPRNPLANCAPVHPHQYVRVNNIFEVARRNGGYTAWSDKHLAYELVNGPSGQGVNDLYNPEIASEVVPLANVPGCTSVVDPTATDDWTSSFENIKCYDKLKVQAIINQINGKTHDGSQSARVPTIFGMNFQAVSVGQKLVQASINATGGYLDALGTPSNPYSVRFSLLTNRLVP